MADKFLFFLSALGVFNAFLLSIYFLTVKKGRRQVDFFVGLLLMLLTIRVGISSIQFFGVLPQAVIKLGLVAQLVLGPTILFLVASEFTKNKSTKSKYLRHIIVWLLVAIIAWMLFDFKTWDWRIRFVIHTILTFYLLWTFYVYRDHFFRFLNQPEIQLSSHFGIIIYVAFVLTCLGFVLSLFTSYILGPLVFTLVFYSCSIYFIISKPKEVKSKQAPKLEGPKLEQIKRRLNELMEIDHLYRNPDLKLESLAQKLSVSRHYLSRLLNENLQKNFREFINEYRVEDACRMLDENKAYSMEAIGYEVGFSSRSTFFSTFKKIKGITPSKYQSVS